MPSPEGYHSSPGELKGDSEAIDASVSPLSTPPPPENSMWPAMKTRTDSSVPPLQLEEGAVVMHKFPCKNAF